MQKDPKKQRKMPLNGLRLNEGRGNYHIIPSLHSVNVG